MLANASRWMCRRMENRRSVDTSPKLRNVSEGVFTPFLISNAHYCVVL